MSSRARGREPAPLLPAPGLFRWTLRRWDATEPWGQTDFGALEPWGLEPWGLEPWGQTDLEFLVEIILNRSDPEKPRPREADDFARTPTDALDSWFFPILSAWPDLCQTFRPKPHTAVKSH